MALEILPVWQAITPELEADSARFWMEHGAMLDAEQAAKRAAQLVCIARDGGRLVGVSTAYGQVVPLLRQPMYLYRNYITPEFRNQGLSVGFINASFDALEQHELAKERVLCLGVAVYMQNKRLARHYDQAYWWQSKFTFAGVSHEGEDLRVRYFEGVRLPPPRPLQPLPPKRQQRAKAPAA